MKTDKSTIECTEYNTLNTDAIAIGVVEAHEPSDRIVKQEAEAAARKQAQFEEAATELAVLKQLDPATDGNKVLGVHVIIEKTGSNYSNYNTGWKMVIGSHDNRKWLKIGDGKILGLDAKQKAKALVKIAEVFSVKQTVAQVKEATLQRYLTFIEAPVSKEFVKVLTRCTYLSDYSAPDGFRIETNGKIAYNGETFTVGQWEQVIALRAVQAEAMKALKATFKV